MKYFISCLVLLTSLMTTTTGFAQQNEVVFEQKIYKSVDGRELKADIFYGPSAKQTANNPAIAFFHGGGWIFGSPEEFHGACRRYAGMGFVTISFQYRLSINEDGTYPNPDITLVECVKDARSAIRWLRENANQLKIDPDRIAVGGQSAGGQLALSTALMEDINEETDNLEISPVPNVILLYSSNVNTMEAWIDMIMGERRNEIWSVSPYHNLKEGMPPIIAFHGEDDCTVLPYIINFFRIRMQELGNSYELITYPGRKHYLGEGNEKYARYFDEEILKRTDEFLEQQGFMK
jgi:acetyl esterase/lipase